MKKLFSIYQWSFLLAVVALFSASCQKGNLTPNNNVAGAGTVGISASLFLNHITFSMYKGGGVMETVSGNISEEPWGVISHFDQYYLSNYSYYQGINSYNWSNTATQYDGMLKYTILMEQQAAATNPLAATSNVYYGLGKFFRAYTFIWLSQRVGDIPMTEAGSSSILHPKYDAQKDVYKNSLALLDSANLVIGNLIAKNNSANTVVDATGDIFGLTYLQWQKVINSYRLRVLISLSKRATDNADLNIQQQFATIIGNPAKYPIFTANADNLVFKYTSVNNYPALANAAYTGNANISKTYLDLTVSKKDPRVFVVATPAPAQLAAPNSKLYSDFSAFIGADPNLALGDLLNNSNSGKYSFANWNYYNKSNSTGGLVEPFILIGYPELCFNIAEAYNRGWIGGAPDDVNAAAWYGKGIDASLSLYKLTQGQSYTVADKSGTAYGTVIIDIATFKTNAAYAGGAAGLRQILEQKYIAFFQNSGWEAFYNQRRTGYPVFGQGGAGIGTANGNLPRRWQYPVGEQNENAVNWKAAVQSQFGGTDDVMKDMWLTK
jgi:hypothetical protein